MSDLRKAAEMALKRLERSESELHKARAELRQALVQPEWVCCVCGEPEALGIVHSADAPCFHYTKREWVKLTKDEVDSWDLPESPTVFEFVQFVEAKLKEKNA